ncbi:MAG: translation initiation factor [Nitrospirae bacterium]|nr:translation initiation factor [Nitrospirota bacterium]
MVKWTMPEEKSKLVYSTDMLVPRKENRRGDRPFAPTAPDSADQKATHYKVIVRLDRKRRAGKSVTVIEGLHGRAKDREALLKELKTGLGTGGTVKDTSLEIQGDHCDALIAELKKLGYRPKRSGG